MKRWAVAVGVWVIAGYHVMGAAEYPSVGSLQDIQSLYLKSSQAINAKKQEVKGAFYKNIEDFLHLPMHKMKSQRVLQTWDETLAHIEHAMNVFQLVSMVEPDDVLRKSYQEAFQELQQDYITKITDSPELYQKFVELKEKEQKRKTLSKEELYYLTNLMEEMEIEGLHLSQEKRAHIKTLKVELSRLSQEFANNIQEDQSGVVAEKGALRGVSEKILGSLASPEEGSYRLTCDYPTYFSVMGSCHEEKTRQRLYRAFHNRAYPQNVAVLEQMIAKRDELAKALGFTSFAHYQLSREMVKEPAKAEQFLAKMLAEVTSKQQGELEEIKAIVPSVKVTEEGKLAPWDALYAEQQVKELRYSLNQEQIKEYFPLEKTIAGLVWLFENFLGLKMTLLPMPGLWHEDVQLVKIADTSHVYGYILLDLFPRPSKYSHACHGTIVAGIESFDKKSTTSLGIVIANFPKPTDKTPSLLSFSDVKTFFHELGHAIHAVMGRTQFVMTSGTHVKVDFVELPSQMLEEWLYEPEILRKVSSHYVHGHPLPDEWIAKIQQARFQATGQFVSRQCFLSKLSLACFAPGADKDTNALTRSLHEAIQMPYFYDGEAHFQASFGHLDEYGARYYGYLWSRVFAADVFEQIKKEGLLNPKAGKRYLKEILSKGGSQDPWELLRSYLGREPTQTAFLKMYGFK